MRYLFLLLTFLPSIAFADIYVLYDNATEEVYSLSSKDDAVCPSDKSKDIIKGELNDLDLTYPMSWYTYKDKRLKLNMKKVEEEAQKENEARKKAEREQKIYNKMKEIAEKALIQSGEIQAEVE